MLLREDTMKPVVIRGVLPEAELKVSDIAQQTHARNLAALRPGSSNVVLGSELARSLDVKAGDKVRLLVAAPNGAAMQPGQISTRQQVFTVADVFDSGNYQFDSALAFVHVEDAEALQGVSAPVRPAPAPGRHVRGAEGGGGTGARTRRALLRARLDPRERDLVRRRAVAKAHDVRDPHDDHRGGRLQPGLDPGDDGARQAGRHRDPAHPGRLAAIRHAHLRDPGDAGRRASGRCSASPSACCSRSTSTSSCPPSSTCWACSSWPRTST
jgi:hypothetical protein